MHCGTYNFRHHGDVTNIWSALTLPFPTSADYPLAEASETHPSNLLGLRLCCGLIVIVSVHGTI